MPVSDYLKTRRHLSKSLIVSAIPSIIALIYTCAFDLNASIKPEDIFNSSLGIQINAIAILISFSIAIITIIVSSDSKNINRLRQHTASDDNYKPLNEEKLTLFQVLLSNITYNTIVEVAYLLIMVAELFLQYIIPVYVLKYLASINIFFMIYILYTLLESIAQMYFTFWKEVEEKAK